MSGPAPGKAGGVTVPGLGGAPRSRNRILDKRLDGGGPRAQAAAMLPARPRSLDIHELSRLERFLRSRACGPDAMGVSRAHGFLTAGVCGPEELTPDEWIRLVFDEPVFESGEQAEDMLGLALALYREIEAGLGEGDFRPVLEYVRWGEEAALIDPRPWCLGFLSGTDLFRELWTAHARGVLQEPLTLIHRLACAEPEAGMTHARLCAALPLAAQAIHAYWHGTAARAP